MEYDTALKQHVGQFGRYQVFLVILISLTMISSGYFNMSYVFNMAVPAHWCHLPELGHMNLSMSEIKKFAIPSDPEADSYHKCQMYDRNYVNMTEEYVREYLAANMTSPDNTTVEVIGCRNGWVFDKSVYSSSLVSEWHLVCSRKWIRGTTQSCFLFGFLIGSLITGYISDMFGRRKALAISVILLLGFGFAQVYANSYILYSAIRFLVAILVIGSMQSGFCLIMELVGPDWRVLGGNVFMVTWGIGYILIGGVAYFVRDHVTFSLIFTCSFVVLLLLPVFAPESPRWLIATGRKTNAYSVLRKLAKWNGRRLPTEIDITIKEEKQQTRIMDLFRTTNLRKMTLMLSFIWFTNNFVYYAISWNTSGLGGNVYLNFVIAAAVEIPAYTYTTWVMGKFGRRIPLFQAMVTTGICLICIIPIPQANHVPIVVIAMIGKFFITASFAMIWVYTPELYPTVNRTLGLGFNSAISRFGGIIAAQVPLFGDVSRILVLLLFGLVSISAGLLVLLLPETKGVLLPETIADSERLAGNQSIRDKLCLCKKKGKGKFAFPESSSMLDPGSTKLSHHGDETSGGVQQGTTLL